MAVDAAHQADEARPGVRRTVAQGLVDVLLAGGSATAIMATTSVAAEPSGQSSAWAAYVLGAALGLPLLFRRQWPVTVLVVSMVIVLIYNLTDYPSISPVWPLLLPLYTVAEAGLMAIAGAVGGSMLLIAVGWIAHSKGEWALYDGVVREAVLLAVVLSLGAATHNRGRWAAELKARLQAERRQQERETARRMMEERLSIARDLHDVTAHALAVAGIQTGLARELVDDDPQAAKEVLDTTRQITVEAINELQAAVRLLRGADAPTAPELHPMPDETQLPGLVERAADSGMRTGFTVEGTRRPVPPGVGLTLYRIAQESLTNVLKHATGASQVQVTLRYDTRGVALDVVDDGAASGPPPDAEPADAMSPRGGYGLTGMLERATSMGGTLSAEPVADGPGFAVRAWLPLAAPEREPARDDQLTNEVARTGR